MRRILLLGAASLGLAAPAFAQDYRSEFGKAFRAADTTATGQALRRWYAARPQDPEFYVAKFNALLKQGEAIELRPDQGPGEHLVIKDKKGRAVGTLGAGHRPDAVQQACAVLRQGLKLAPERLDMWFGLAKTYEESRQPAEQVAALTQALSAHKAGQPWRWLQGGELPAPEAEFVPQALEEYAAVYWQQATPEALETGRQLAELIVRYYPQSSLGPFNLGAYYGIKGDARQAYPYLQQADRLQPNDPTNVANLAQLALELGRRPEAQQYVERLAKFPDTAATVKELRKKLK